MSETLVIDTSDGLFREERVEPLPLLSEMHPMLKMTLEEYKTPLPNTPMDTLIARMKMTMKLYGGIGLSSNQVGVMHRMFIMGTDDFFSQSCLCSSGVHSFHRQRQCGCEWRRLGPARTVLQAHKSPYWPAV